MNNAAASLQRHYDEWPTYKEEASWLGWCGPEKLVACLRRHLHGNEKILDVGCGPGFLGSEFQKLQWRGILIGVDISSRQLQKTKEESIYNSCALANANCLSFPNESFDVVVSSGMVGLTGPRSMREMYRVLRRGGYLAIVAGEIVKSRCCARRFRKSIIRLKKLPNVKILLEKDLKTGYLNSNRKTEHYVLYIAKKQ